MPAKAGDGDRGAGSVCIEGSAMLEATGQAALGEAPHTTASALHLFVYLFMYSSSADMNSQTDNEV